MATATRNALRKECERERKGKRRKKQMKSAYLQGIAEVAAGAFSTGFGFRARRTFWDKVWKKVGRYCILWVNYRLRGGVAEGGRGR